MLRIALASPPVAGAVTPALSWVERYLGEAASQGADIVCFPETYIPGLRGWDFEVEAHDQAALEKARDQVCALAKQHALFVILAMEWGSPEGLLNVAFVISDKGEILGCQSKCQLAPEEDPYYVAGSARELFEVKGVPFGIVICHEGWRYPETVRWAAREGARIVFHPTLTGSDKRGKTIDRFGAADSPYYEKAMVCRGLENAVFFASANYGFVYQEAATAVIDPVGRCLSHAPYGEPSLLLVDIDPDEATRIYAKRFRPETYRGAAPRLSAPEAVPAK